MIFFTYFLPFVLPSILPSSLLSFLPSSVEIKINQSSAEMLCVAKAPPDHFCFLDQVFLVLVLSHWLSSGGSSGPHSSESKQSSSSSSSSPVVSSRRPEATRAVSFCSSCMTTRTSSLTREAFSVAGLNGKVRMKPPALIGGTCWPIGGFASWTWNLRRFLWSNIWHELSLTLLNKV